MPTVTLFSAKDLEEQMKIIKDTVGDDKKDWKQRMDSVCVEKNVISLLVDNFLSAFFFHFYR